jgi:hypothetical protein
MMVAGSLPALPYPSYLPFAPSLSLDSPVGFGDSHGPEFIVPAFLLVPECDHSTSNMVTGFQDGYLESREAAVISRDDLSLLPSLCFHLHMAMCCGLESSASGPTRAGQLYRVWFLQRSPE